ncbi:hypothetical protein AC578_9449 [Pseudocercospora eumusae]|uniref:Uncharacterized protein n=1 Tax=Pseudocercospora eumusae TaxID=321146 RepID=A0A139GYG2_9PEZI|nr:hypothetical protein AC578_9449 [Pseudocercospora eumusae]
MASPIMSTLQQGRYSAVAKPAKKQRKKAKSDLVAGRRVVKSRLKQISMRSSTQGRYVAVGPARVVYDSDFSYVDRYQVPGRDDAANRGFHSMFQLDEARSRKSEVLWKV